MVYQVQILERKPILNQLHCLAKLLGYLHGLWFQVEMTQEPTALVQDL